MNESECIDLIRGVRRADVVESRKFRNNDGWFTDVNALMDDLIAATMKMTKQPVSNLNQRPDARGSDGIVYEFTIEDPGKRYSAKGDETTISRYINIRVQIFPTGEFKLMGRARFADHENRNVKKSSGFVFDVVDVNNLIEVHTERGFICKWASVSDDSKTELMNGRHAVIEMEKTGEMIRAIRPKFFLSPKERDQIAAKGKTDITDAIRRIISELRKG